MAIDQKRTAPPLDAAILNRLDKLPEAPTTSRAIGVQARTLESLERRGLAETLVRLGPRWQRPWGAKRVFRPPSAAWS